VPKSTVFSKTACWMSIGISTFVQSAFLQGNYFAVTCFLLFAKSLPFCLQQYTRDESNWRERNWRIKLLRVLINHPLHIDYWLVYLWVWKLNNFISCDFFTPALIYIQIVF
jgi:hypothetical protein